MRNAHADWPFDALATIRGGGSVTDLAWLNDLEIPRRLYPPPLPILTGVGYQRNGTILYAVAHRRFDTRSEVALHISQTIRDNAGRAFAALERIRLSVGRVLPRERMILSAQADRVISLGSVVEPSSISLIVTSEASPRANVCFCDDWTDSAALRPAC